MVGPRRQHINLRDYQTGRAQTVCRCLLVLAQLAIISSKDGNTALQGDGWKSKRVESPNLATREMATSADFPHPSLWTNICSVDMCECEQKRPDLDKRESCSRQEGLLLMLQLILHIGLHTLLGVNLLLFFHAEQGSGGHSNGDGVLRLWLQEKSSGCISHKRGQRCLGQREYPLRDWRFPALEGEGLSQPSFPQ